MLAWKTVSSLALSLAVAVGASTHAFAHEASTTTYHTVKVAGLNMFYRETGPKHAPAILLLHGFPSSSRMFERLMPLLSDKFRLIAPDYIGYGHSDAPSPAEYNYTFDQLATSLDALLTELKLERYAIYMSDFGGPVGMRIASAHPERVTALIVQNAVSHEEGLSETRWKPVRAFWADRVAHEATMRQGFALQATRYRHVSTSPHPERYDPDSWTDEFAFLSRPGQHDIQLDLFYDYRNNLAAYPAWQAYLSTHQPPTLVTWGKYDPSFTVAGAYAYQRQVPSAQVHVLEAGHFALDEANDEIARLIRPFMEHLPDAR